MEIREEQAGQLTIETSVGENVFAFLLSISWFIVLAFLVVIAVASEPKWVGKIAGSLALFIVWILFSFIFGADAAFRCVLDRNLRLATISFRAPWFLWIPRMRKVPLDQVTAIVFSKVDDERPKLSFRQKSGRPIAFAGDATIDIAERLGRFLQIPLYIELGSERITHIAWSTDKNASLVPTPCVSCGAPLPKIEPHMKSIKCSHCGMNMIIQWQDDKLSYRAESESDI